MWRPICDKLHVDEVFGKDREPQTLRDYLRRIGTEIGHVPVDTASILRDMDTPAQYRQELAEYLNRQPVEQAG